MGQICWDFPLLGSGNESGSNIAAITLFNVGAGVMDSLAREVCQNSLDAKNKNLPSDVPVRVKFELQYIKQSDFPMFTGYSDAIKRSREYWENSPLKNDDIMAFLDYIETALSKEMVPVLVMSDYNTTGLRGVNALENEKSFWNLLVNTEGISIKEDKSSAGSYGIGKNAPFAYSALNLVFYNTLATDGGRAFEGVARLATTTRDCGGKKRKTQPIGKYLYLENEYDWRPILPADNCALANLPMFERAAGEFGTDVAVFGFKEEEYSNWEILLASAVIKNFVIAIKDGKLEVAIKSETCNYEINKTNIAEYLFDEFKEVPELKYTRQIYKTLVEPDKRVDTRIAEENDLTIFVKYSETYSQSLSRFRSTGMLINTTTGDVLPHFSVVIIMKRWRKKDDSVSLDRRFCAYTGRGSLLYYNAISRLWWSGYLTYEEDKERTDPWQLTKILFSAQQIQKDLFDQPFCMNRIVVQGLLRALKRIQEEQGNACTTIFRKCCDSYLNHYGAVSILDTLSADEVEDIAYSYMKSI